MRGRVYLRDYTNLLRKTKILQIPFTSQQAQIFEKNMKQFIWTYGRRNIITYPRLKHRMLKFQFMTIRTNVTGDTTKVTNMNKFRNISIPNSKFSLRYWILPQQKTIWSNMTNNTTKTDLLYSLTVSLDIGLETSASTSEVLHLSNLAK